MTFAYPASGHRTPMAISDEIRRLEDEPRSDEECGGIGTVTLVGLCRQDAPAVAGRCRDVLRLVLRAGVDASISLPEWEAHLPSWFVDACAPEMPQDQLDPWLEKWRAMTPEERRISEEQLRWSLSNWLHRFQPSERQWEYWDCRADSGTVRLQLKIDAWPFAHGALGWLLRAAGADRVILESEASHALHTPGRVRMRSLATMTMTHHQKVNHLLQTLPRRFWPPAAPLVYRFLWRLGIPVPPPHFLPAGAHLLGGGTVMTLLLVALLHVRPLRPEQGFGLFDLTVALGIALPVAMYQAVVYPRSARRLHLGPWDRYPYLQDAGVDRRNQSRREAGNTRA